MQCPDCGTSVFLSPGPLNADRTVEYRRCEDGHVVETTPHFFCAPSDATRVD